MYRTSEQSPPPTDVMVVLLVKGLETIYYQNLLLPCINNSYCYLSFFIRIQLKAIFALTLTPTIMCKILHM